MGLAPRVSNLGNLVEHSRSVALLLLRNGSYFSLSLSIVSFVIRRKLRRVGCRERFYKPIVWTGPEVW